MISSILKRFSSLYDDGGAAIGHFDQFGNFCNGTNIFQVTYRWFFHRTVFLRNHTYQFVSLISISYCFNTLIPANSNG